MREIPLTQNKVAIIDDEDYEYINQWKWDAHKSGRSWYAERQGSTKMHRIINNTPKGYDTDHINGDGLDNRRCNLRTVTRRQNTQNRHTPKSSKYPGVHWIKRDKRWQSRIRVGKDRISLGYFRTEIVAYYAYLLALEKIYEVVVPITSQDGITAEQKNL